MCVLDLGAFFHILEPFLSDGDGAGSRSLVVLPTYNERDNLEPIVRQVLSKLSGATVWVVDDNSPDGTGEVADRLAAEDHRIRVIHREGKLGLGTAYVTAFTKALSEDFDSLVQMDADFSHDPRYLPELLDALHEADLVIGSRYTAGGGTQNWSALRRAISRGGNWVARLGLGLKTQDATGGFRAFRRSTLEQLDYDDLGLRGYGFQIEVVYQVEERGLRIVEIPIIFVERASGESKMSKGIVWEAIVHIARRRLRMRRRDRARRPDPRPQGETVLRK
jgi:dolichol-phosphate mannosyltransferase